MNAALQSPPGFSGKRNAHKHDDRASSRVRHLITYATLRRCIWYNLAGAMLYVFGGCLPRAIWFSIVPLENERTGTNSGFPWYVVSFGPSQVNETAFGRGMFPEQYVAETCDATRHADFLEWVEHLRSHTDINQGGDASLDNRALIRIGPNPNGGEKCITAHSQVVCDRNAADPEHRVNRDDPDDNHLFTVEVRNGRRVCASRRVPRWRRTIFRSHGSWRMSLQIQCQRPSTCRDESGSWCRTQLQRDKTLFERVCGLGANGQPVMPVIRERCRYSCTIAGVPDLCPEASVDHVRNLINSRVGSHIILLPEYLQREAEAFCAFRHAIAYSLYMARVGLFASAGCMVLTSFVILQAQWERLVVASCAVAQVVCLLFFAYYLIPLCFMPHAAPTYARVALNEYLDRDPGDELANDQQLLEVHELFKTYIAQSPQWTAELRIVIIGMLAQVWGALMTIGWWTEVVQTRRVNAMSVLTTVLRCSMMTLVYWPIVQTGKLMEKLGITSSEYSAPNYATRTGIFCCKWRRSKTSPYYGWEWKHLGDRPKFCFGLPCLPIPPALGSLVGDVFCVFGHLQRMYEWDGFLEQNRICSAQEKKDMEGMGISNRCMHNLLAWRRSVLVLCVLMGFIIMPMGLFETSRAMDSTQGAGHGQNVLLWPTEWEDFQLEWRLRARANGTLEVDIQPASFGDYSFIQQAKFFAMLGNVDSGAVQWLHLFTTFTETMAFFSVFFALVSWLWWSLSKRMVLYAAVALVYAPILASMIPTRYFVREEAWSDIDLFVKTVMGNAVQHLGLDMSIVDCWPTIEVAMRSVTRYREASVGLCNVVTGSVSSTLIRYAGGEGFVNSCREFLDQRIEITANMNTMQSQVAGACVGMQEAFFGEHDDEIPFVAIYNRTVVDMITERTELGRRFFDLFMENQRHTIRLYAGAHSAFNTFITLLPACLSVVPAALVAAWRVRLLMPLSRLPGIIIISLPWIYAPILWVQVLPLWQLTDPLLMVAILCLSFGTVNWILTSYVFGTTEPMPGEQLSAALRKQGWIDFTFTALGITLILIWLTRPYLDGQYEQEVDDAYGIRNWFRDFISNWGEIGKQVSRYAFKYLILRLAAMDFIMSQLMSDHLFEMGIDAIDKVITPMLRQGLEDEGDEVKRQRTRTDSDDREFIATAANIDVEHMESFLDWTLYEDWELIAMQDVVEMKETRAETLEALSALETSGLLLPLGQHEAPTEIELAEVSLEGIDRAARDAEWGRGELQGQVAWQGQPAPMNQSSEHNFFTLMRDHKPEYQPEVYQRRKSMRQPLLGNPTTPQFNVQQARRKSMAARSRSMIMPPQTPAMRR